MANDVLYPDFLTTINIQIPMAFGPHGYDPFDFLVPEGTAQFYIIDENSEEPQHEPCGRATFAVINAGEALNQGENIIEICDARSQELFDVAEVFFNDAFKKKWNGTPLNSCLYISELASGPIPPGSAVFAVESSFGHNCELVAVAHDMDAYGFSQLSMPQWKAGIDLWWLNRCLVSPDYPIVRPTAKIIRPPKTIWKRNRKGRGNKEKSSK